MVKPWFFSPQRKIASDERAAAEAFEKRLSNLNTLLVHAPLGIAFLDRSYRYVRINDAFAPVHDLVPGSHVGERLATLNPATLHEIKGTLDAVLAGETLVTRVVTPHAGEVASPQHWSVQYFPVRVGNVVAGIGCIGVDITGLIESEKALAAKTGLYDMLSGVNALVHTCRSADELFSEVCSIAVSAGGFGFAWVGTRDGDTVRVKASAGVDNDHTRTLKISLDPASELSRGPTGQVFLRGIHTILNDARVTSATAPWHEALIQMNFYAAASFPICVGGTVAASFTLYSSERGFFGAECVATLESMMLILGGALERITSEEDTRLVVEELHMHDRALQAISQGIVISDPLQPDNPIVYASDSFSRLVGYSSEEVLGRNCRFLQGTGTNPASIGTIRSAIANEEACVVEILNYRKDGSAFWNQLSLSPVHNDLGVLINFVGVQTDVTQRRELEREVTQSQRLESLATLAGGIAHDVNNILLVIRGYNAVLAAQSADPDVEQITGRIDLAVQHAADFTHQLLTFTSDQIARRELTDLTGVVQGTLEMLHHMMGENIELLVDFASEPLLAYVDRSLVQQAVLNLVTNSFEAMPEGGTLSVQTCAIDAFDGFALVYGDISPGSYVLLQVSDTGSGMDDDTQAHAFDPFFTTKAKGTGLGLSTLYGAVKQSGGHVRLRSKVGVGTTFELYFPIASVTISEAGSLAAPLLATGSVPALHREVAGGPESVLVVDDNDEARDLLVSELVRLGYDVLQASDGAEALEILGDSSDPIDVLITDVSMESVSGIELADHVFAAYRAVGVVFTSAFFAASGVHDTWDRARFEIVHKPYAMSDVTSALRRLIDSRDPSFVSATPL